MGKARADRRLQSWPRADEPGRSAEVERLRISRLTLAARHRRRVPRRDDLRARNVDGEVHPIGGFARRLSAPPGQDVSSAPVSTPVRTKPMTARFASTRPDGTPLLSQPLKTDSFLSTRSVAGADHGDRCPDRHSFARQRFGEDLFIRSRITAHAGDTDRRGPGHPVVRQRRPVGEADM